MSSTSARRVVGNRRFEWWLLLGGLLAAAFVLRFDIDGDAAVRYEMLQRLIEQHQLSTAKFSMVQPLAAVPLYAVGKIVGQPERAVRRFNLVVFSLMLWVVVRRLSDRADDAALRRWCLLMFAGSMFLHHLRMFYSEVFSVAAVVVGLVWMSTGAAVAGAIALCVGVVNAPALIGALALVALKLAWDRQRYWYLGLPVVCAGAIMLEAWIRRGSPFSTGYEQEFVFRTLMPYSGVRGFSYPFILGVASILFSFGKGLLFFAPGLFLPATTADRSLRRLHQMLMLFAVGMVLTYAKWFAWYGGWFWGPRYFLFASVPASLALSLQLDDRSSSVPRTIAALGVLALSAWVAIDGAVFGLERLAQIGVANNYAFESYTWYIPEFSPLWYPVIEHRQLAIRDWLVVGYVLVAAAWLAVEPIKRLTSSLTFRVRRAEAVA